MSGRCDVHKTEQVGRNATERWRDRGIMKEQEDKLFPLKCMCNSAFRGADVLSWHHPSLINSKYANHSVASKALQNVWIGWAERPYDTLMVCFPAHLTTAVCRLPDSYVIWWGKAWHRFCGEGWSVFLVLYDCVCERVSGAGGGGTRGLWHHCEETKGTLTVKMLSGFGALKQPSTFLTLPALFIIISCCLSSACDRTGLQDITRKYTHTHKFLVTIKQSLFKFVHKI